jgi:hypothetical protein
VQEFQSVQVYQLDLVYQSVTVFQSVQVYQLDPAYL